MSSTGSGRFCPFCGANNPAEFNFCGNCHRVLPAKGVAPPAGPPPPSDSFQLVTSQTYNSATTLNVGRSTGGLVFLIIGIPLLILGILLLVAAGIAAAGTASFNQACSMNPVCTPASDPSGALAGGGVVLLLIGLALAGYGVFQYQDRAG